MFFYQQLFINFENKVDQTAIHLPSKYFCTYNYSCIRRSSFGSRGKRSSFGNRGNHWSPMATEATIGHQWWPSAINLWSPLVPIGIIYFNGSVAIDTDRYQLPPMLVTNDGHQWEKSECTLYKLKDIYQKA